MQCPGVWEAQLLLSERKPRRFCGENDELSFEQTEF